VNGVETSYDPYSTDTPVDYTDGAKFSFNGISFTIKGTPNEGDVFSLSKTMVEVAITEMHWLWQNCKPVIL